MRKGRTLGTALAVALAFLLLPARAHAYTDPGSGMLIWQALMAALVGAGFYFRKFLIRFFPYRKSDKDES
ncbi:MAG: hypothetical protein ACRD2R_09805 [Terriglobales bacterium]